MAKECIGKEVNKSLIKKLESIVKSMQVNANDFTDQTQIFKTDFEDEHNNPIYIFCDTPGETPELYSAIVEFSNYISFEKTTEEAYEIPGVEIAIDRATPDKKEPHTIYVTKKMIQEVKQSPETRKKFEKTIKTLNIELPEEFYQLIHENLIPGLGYEAPLPKKFGESEEDYEKRMEEHYKKEGVDKEELEGYRRPFPHENVRYKKETPEMTDTPRESYVIRLQQKALSPAGAEKGGSGLGEGERRRVVDTDPTLGQRFNKFLQTSKGVLKSKKTVGAVLCTVAGTALIGGSLVINPLPTLAVLGTTGAFLGIAVVAKKYGSKAIKAISKKWNDWLRGPVIENPGAGSPTTEPPINTPPTGGGNNGGSGQGGQGGSGNNGGQNGGSANPDPTEVPEDLVSVLSAINSDSEVIKKLDSQIALAENNLEVKKEEYNNAPEDKKANIQKEIDIIQSNIDKLKADKKDSLLRMYALLQQYVNDKKLTTGGPSL